MTGHFYVMPNHYEPIRQMVIKAAKEADEMGAPLLRRTRGRASSTANQAQTIGSSCSSLAGVKYLGLAALNKAEWLNRGGKDLLEPLKGRNIRVVHGNTLTAAAIFQALLLYTRPSDEVRDVSTCSPSRPWF